MNESIQARALIEAMLIVQSCYNRRSWSPLDAK